MKSKTEIHNFGRFIFLISFCLISVILISAQDEQDEDPPSRSIVSKDFQSKRKKNAQATTGTRQKSVTTNSKRRYKYTNRKRYTRKKTSAQTKSTIRKPKYSVEELGVTFWRLRPLNAVEKYDREVSLFSVLTDKLNGKRENWTAERVNSTTKFRKGDRVRFTIESSRTGYLYIFNREFYTDGTYGEPTLIFPTLRTRGGDNSVRAGSLIEIPSAADSVQYFTVLPRRNDYAGEELVIIITAKPNSEIKTEAQAQRITREKIEDWLTEWVTTVDVYDAEDGEGIAYSKAEASAANNVRRELTQEEPLPQTIYRVKVREDLPLIVPFQMQAESP